MRTPREDWLQWAEALHRYRADGIVSWLLEAGRPLAIVAAQLLYWGRPFLGDMAQDLGKMLESDEDAREFAKLLNGGMP